MQGRIRSSFREAHQEDISVFTVGMEIHPWEHLEPTEVSSWKYDPEALFWTTCVTLLNI